MTAPAAPPPAADAVHDVIIVGAGFSGIGMAALLLQAGIDSFVVLEKAGDVGGTWRENTYPGAACDIPSHLYSFSFEPKADWTRSFSPQAEILEYLRHCAAKYRVAPHVRFHTRAERAVFDERAGVWSVYAHDGRVYRGRALVLGNGALHLPARPEIPGRESFAGAAFHSAEWDHAYPLDGKRVGVIGTGASAVQFVPRIAPRVARLALFQRTPPWIVPKLDRPFTAQEQARFARHPWWHRAYRAGLYWRHEAALLGFTVEPRVMKLGERIAKRHMAASITDPALRRALTPDYRMGCKRILPSNDYYPALARANVAVVTTPIEAITPRGVRTRDGVEHALDAIIYGTGFRVAEYLTPIAIAGAGGRDLAATWRAAPEAYLGITVAGFPNLYLLMGPNTGLGHNSMIFMIEAQARYALQCIEARRARRLVALDVRPEVQSAFNRALQARLADTVWASGCRSWYQVDGNGRNASIWPGWTWEYWLRTRTLALADYVAR